VPASGGVVEHTGRAPYGALLRLDQPGPGVASLGAVAWGGATLVTLSFYLYGDQAAGVVARQQPAWQAWIGKHFPAPPVEARGG
jgi:hypothetical protein